MSPAGRFPHPPPPHLNPGTHEGAQIDEHRAHFFIVGSRGAEKHPAAGGVEDFDARFDS